MRRVVGALVALGLVVGLLGTAVVGSAMAMFGIDAQPTATTAASARIPPAMLTLYQQAAATCPGLPWTILAAIGTVESDSGQSNQPGVHDGANAAGAEGPMQFLPSNFSKCVMTRTTVTCSFISPRFTLTLDMPSERAAKSALVRATGLRRSEGLSPNLAVRMDAW